MTKYNPNIHHRRSIRLKAYDYSQAGLYFITICTQNRLHLLGEIIVGEDLRTCPNTSLGEHTSSGEHVGSPLHRVVQWFKTRSTNEYNRISQYIIDKPLKWENDKLNGGDGNRVMEPSADYNSENGMVL